MGHFYQDIFYTYSDITIMPSRISNIDHRVECNPYDCNGMLPLFTAPMDTVVNEDNFKKFESEKIYPILPRTFDLDKRVQYSIDGKWASYSLDEFESVFCNFDNKIETSYCELYVSVDIANGHMERLIEAVKKAKSIYGSEIKIMAGNIANPRAYFDYAYSGVDYVRVGIGSGFACTTQSNTGVGCGMATLIHKVAECQEIYCEQNDISIKDCTKIIADGGIRKFSDIIKALALGADYVMCGSVFCKMLESAAPKSGNSAEWLSLPLTTSINDIKDIHKEDDGWHGLLGGKEICLGDINAIYYGMASREGQIALNGSKTKTSEGIKKVVTVDYTMHGWCENFTDFLRSSMSYVGSECLYMFKKSAIIVINSKNAIAAVNE